MVSVATRAGEGVGVAGKVKDLRDLLEVIEGTRNPLDQARMALLVLEYVVDVLEDHERRLGHVG